MITEPTVFIIGAGAHAPYGFPSGEKLKEAIYGLSAEQFHARETYQRMIADHLPGLRTKLRQAGTQSIDAFFQHNKALAEFGRICVALLIKRFEASTKNVSRHDWIEWLLDKPMNCRLSDFNANQVAFITFNYDRCLEYRLTSLLTARHGDKYGASIAVRNIPIIHVHGSIGKLPFPGEAYSEEIVPYGAETDYEFTCRSSGSIRFYDEEGFRNESASHKDGLARAAQLIKDAKNVFFLGLSYQAENLRALQWTDISSGKYIDGTAYGEPPGRISHLRKAVFRYERLPSDEFERCPTCKEWTAYDFVKNCDPLLAFSD